MKFSLSLLFLPQTKNNHRALLLQPAFLTVLIGIYLLNQSFIRFITFIKPGVLGYSSEITIEKVLDLTNQERAKYNLPPLHFNSKLSESATKKAQNMFTENYWAHNSPSGLTPWNFFKNAGYNYSVAGENLARDFYDTDSMMQAWMNSPTHKANIVSDKYQEIGIGVVNGQLNGVKTTLVVQHFGTPLDGAIADDPLPSSPQFSTPQVLANQSPESLISPLALNKIISLVLFALIMGVLIVDSYITLKNRTHRMTGSTTGHIGFLIIIFMFMLFSRSGAIF